MHSIPWSSVKKEEMSALLTRQAIHGSKITIAIIHLSKGAIVPVHSHESEQMAFIMEGTMRFFGGSREIIVRKNEVLVIPPWEEHGAEALEECIDLDIFSPPRADWIKGEDAYLRR